MSERDPAGSGVAYEDAGPADGFPVVVCAGSPGSRLLEPRAVAAAQRHGLRLIGYDRPGYGRTPARASRSMADTADDVRRLASELGISRLAVWGISGGGSHALACAALLPDLVAGACVLATFAPYWAEGFDFVDGLLAATAEEVDLFLRDRVAARARFRADVAAMMPSIGDPERWLARWGDRAGVDEAHDRETAAWLAAMCAEALRDGDDGWWCDWEAVLDPWGFEIEDVHVPVRLWHGVRDESVPVGHGRYLASRLPNVVARFGADEDHTDVGANHRDESYAWLRSLGR